ncbi:hypothetical protein NFI96_019211, partial [Prochilodus magdalenae]
MFNPKDMLLSVYGLVILSSSSIICNILLLLKGKITTEVKLSGGFIGGLVRCQAVVLEALGIAGALYNFGVTTYGLMHGHHCEERLGKEGINQRGSTETKGNPDGAAECPRLPQQRPEDLSIRPQKTTSSAACRKALRRLSEISAP